MSIAKSIIFMIIGLIAASAEDTGYPRENPNYRLIYGGESPLEKFTNNEEEMMTGGEIPGEADKDYPIFREVPDTRFECTQQQYPGYYADVEARCQAFHICQRSGRKDSFLCPNGTVFNQENLVCDWWYNFDCANAQSFYSVNEAVVRAMEEADRLSAERKSAEGYRYNSQISGIGGSRFQQQGQQPSVSPPQSNDFDTVVVEAARTSPQRAQLPLQTHRSAYSDPETTGPLSKSFVEDLDSGLNEAPKITGVHFPTRNQDSLARGYLPAKF